MRACRARQGDRSGLRERWLQQDIGDHFGLHDSRVGKIVQAAGETKKKQKERPDLDKRGKQMPDKNFNEEKLELDQLSQQGRSAIGREPTHAEIKYAANMDYAQWWSSILNLLKPKMIEKLKMGITDAINEIDGLMLKQLWEPELNIENPVGFLDWSPSAFTLRLPLNGSYDMKVELRVKYEKEVLGEKIKIDETLILIVRDFHMQQNLRFDTSDPTRIKVKDYSDPLVCYRIDLTGEGEATRLVTAFLDRLIDTYLPKTVDDAVHAITEYIEIIKKQGDILIADKAPLLPAPKQPVGIHEFIENLEHSLITDHFPFDTLMAVNTDREDRTTWEQRFLETAEIKGNIGAFSVTRDSPVFTGIYLASQSYRYAVTKDKKAVDNIREVLKGVDRLFSVNGTGLMARLVVPKKSDLAKKIERRGSIFKEKILDDGEVWVSMQDGGISRDQYLGVLFGLATIYEHVAHDFDDVEKEVKRLLAYQFDFVIENNWFLPGDDNPSGMITFWNPVSDQKYAYLAVNNHVTGGKYKAQLAALRNAVPITWLTAWLNSCNTVAKYYKFNLAYLSYYCILHFETDPFIKKHILKAHSIIERVTHNHLNPHFDLLRIDFGSVEKEQLAGSIRASMAEFIQRGHREAPPAPLTDAHYRYRDIEVDGHKESVPDKPIRPKHRVYADYFQWEKNPWSLAKYPGDNSKKETAGISITWPYWFGRYLDVFSEQD